VGDSTENARVRGVDRVLDLLKALHSAGKPLRIGELARHLNAPRSTTYNLVNRLLEGGILEIYDDHSRVFFGRTLHFYGADYLNNHRLSRLASEEVAALARLTGQTSQFCTLNGNKFTVLHMKTGQAFFKISSDVGRDMPIPWTASGRLLVDHLTAEAIKAFIPAEDFVLPDGHSLDADQFCHEVAQAHAQNFFTTSGLVDDFADCLAVPVRGKTGITLGCMCLIIPRDRALDDRSRWEDALKDSGKRLAQKINEIAPSAEDKSDSVSLDMN
jgi:DNA-binding IclR family transcriptional regulator